MASLPVVNLDNVDSDGNPVDFSAIAVGQTLTLSSGGSVIGTGVVAVSTASSGSYFTIWYDAPTGVLVVPCNLSGYSLIRVAVA